VHIDIPAKATLFQHGQRQAVLLPKEFRFEGSEVFVRRVGDEVILSTRHKSSMDTLIESLREFESNVQLERPDPESVAN
jgi:antitoxin VapB